MQDPSLFQPINPQFPEHEQLNCPRCDSTNTKFCYYNNYNLSQPRHYCKNCRRYWTKGGSLRNIPIGGGSRKVTKRSTSKSSSSNVSLPKSEPLLGSQSVNQDPPMRANYQFRSLIEGLNSNGFAKDPILSSNSSSDQNSTRNPVRESRDGDKDGSFLNVDENEGGSGYWDLAIYTPGSNFH